MKKLPVQQKYIGIILIIIILLTIPLTLHIQQQQQQTESNAAGQQSQMCTLPENTKPGEVFEAPLLNGQQVVPPTDSPAIGKARAVLPAETSVTNITYVSFCYTGLTSLSTGVHLHYPASVGENAQERELIAVALAPEGSLYDFPVIVNDTEKEYLRQGLWYITVDTLQDKDGEIRGQFGTTLPTSVSPTITPDPQTTAVELTVFLHAIGNSGDNANPTSFSLSNKNPIHPERAVTVKIFDNEDKLLLEKEGKVTYNPQSGNFKGTISLGNQLTSGDYVIRLSSPYYLTQRVGGFHSLEAGEINALPQVTLVAGDANKDNVLNILDYNLIIGCYADYAPPPSCNTNTKVGTDLTDDEKVNQFDYNLFLRNLSVQAGD